MAVPTDEVEGDAGSRSSLPAPHVVTGAATLSHWREMVWIAAVVIVTWALCGYFNVTEALRHLEKKPYEYFQLDELPVVMLVAAIALGWFARHLNREVRRELLERQKIERHLAEALDDNRRLARHFVDAQEAERRNLARELHDELGQYLNAIKLDAVAVGNQAAQVSLRGHAQGIIDSVDHVHRVVRGLIRRLRPVALDELGLEAALQHSVDLWRRLLQGATLELTTEGNFGRCGDSVNLAIYRMVQEALTNIARHAHASHVCIRLHRQSVPNGDGSEIQLSIDDDGVGTDLRTSHRGMGLVGMRERTEMLGGTFRVTSAPGRGFSLSAALPVGIIEVAP